MQNIGKDLRAKLMIQWLVNNPDRVVWIDSETTGIAETDEIVEWATVDGNENIIYNKLIKPMVSVGVEASKVNHITDEMLVDKNGFSVEWDEIKNSMENKVVVGWNCNFDEKMLAQTCEHNGIDGTYAHYLFVMKKDMMELVADLYGDMLPQNFKFKQQEMMNILGLNSVEQHRASDDVLDMIHVAKTIATTDFKPDINVVKEHISEKKRIQIEKFETCGGSYTDRPSYKPVPKNPAHKPDNVPVCPNDFYQKYLDAYYSYDDINDAAISVGIKTITFKVNLIKAAAYFDDLSVLSYKLTDFIDCDMNEINNFINKYIYALKSFETYKNSRIDLYHRSIESELNIYSVLAYIVLKDKGLLPEIS